MTALLALGWPLALLAIWRWRVSNRQAWELAELCGKAHDHADFWRSLATTRGARCDELEAELRDMRAAADEWEAATIVWQAVALMPMRPSTLVGRVQ